MFVGIDYGSKLAGTTAITYMQDNELITFQSEKGKDADLFITSHCKTLRVTLVGIDAPLSLPGKYLNKSNKGSYFYRECDQKLKAMSPMFIGGLTARAIQLKDQLLQNPIEVIEVYPKAFVNKLIYKRSYQKKNLAMLPSFVSDLQNEFELNFKNPLENWHQVDSVMAWLIVSNYNNSLHDQIGDPEEGIIIF